MLQFARDSHWLFYDVCYANMVLLTISGVIVWVGLSRLLQQQLVSWTGAALTFVPVYAILALFLYVSQLVTVPRPVADVSTGDPQPPRKRCFATCSRSGRNPRYRGTTSSATSYWE